MLLFELISNCRIFWNFVDSVHKRELNTFERLGFGFVGGVAGAILTMPIDVTKSIAQKQQGLQVMSTLEIVKQVVKTRGIRGLYTGLLPRLGRVGLDRAFGFLGMSSSLWPLNSSSLSQYILTFLIVIYAAFEWTVERLSRYHRWAKLAFFPSLYSVELSHLLEIFPNALS